MSFMPTSKTLNSGSPRRGPRAKSKLDLEVVLAQRDSLIAALRRRIRERKKEFCNGEQLAAIWADEALMMEMK